MEVAYVQRIMIPSRLIVLLFPLFILVPAFPYWYRVIVKRRIMPPSFCSVFTGFLPYTIHMGPSILRFETEMI